MECEVADDDDDGATGVYANEAHWTYLFSTLINSSKISWLLHCGQMTAYMNMSALYVFFYYKNFFE